MNSVWKFPLPIVDDVTIEMPQGARVLHVETQFDSAQMWALVDPNQPLVQRRFKVVGTGHRHEDMDTWHYIGTFPMFGGGLMWHVFEPPT